MSALVALFNSREATPQLSFGVRCLPTELSRPFTRRLWVRAQKNHCLLEKKESHKPDHRKFVKCPKNIQKTNN